MGRAPCCDKATVKKGPWSPEEDAKLKVYIEEHGTGGNWIALPHKIGLKRCGKSCRLRWLNYLRPNIKHGGFSEEEDRIILTLYISIGSRWSIIAAQLPGRTDNDIKNYWNTRLKKKLLCKQQLRELDHISLQPRCRRLPADQPAILEPAAAAAADTAVLNHETLSASAPLERMPLQMQIPGLHSPANFLANNPATALWPEISNDAAIPPNLLIQQYARSDLSSSLLRISGQEDRDHTLGFSQSSSGGAGGGLIGGRDYSSPVAGLQSSTASSEASQMQQTDQPEYDLRELVYGDQHQKGVSMGWWSSDDVGFEEKTALMDGYSASSSPQLDSLMFQYQFGYAL